MNVDVFILARLGSSRLPEKHLKLINGKHAIKRLVDRLKSAKKIRQIIVCTTTDKSDDKLVSFLKKEEILFLGVMKRMYLLVFLMQQNNFKPIL